LQQFFWAGVSEFSAGHFLGLSSQKTQKLHVFVRTYIFFAENKNTIIIMSSAIQSSIIRLENAHNQNIWASTWSHGDLITGK